MALSGVHICYRAFSVPTGSLSTLPFSTSMVSQTMASAGTSSVSAPVPSNTLLSISASAPIWYTTGSSPADPSNANNARAYLDPAFGREDVFAFPGDKLAWVFA